MSIKVKIETEQDCDATKVAAVLEALGYEVERINAGDDGQAWRIREIARKHHLSDTETRVLEALVRDDTQAQIAKALGVSRHEVRWQVSKVVAKTKMGRDELFNYVVNGQTAVARAR